MSSPVADLLQPGLTEKATELSRWFAAAAPFRHVIIKDFLEEDFCKQLMDQFPAFDARHAVNERGEAGRKAVFTDLKRLGPAYARFDAMIRGREFLSFLSRITQIPDLRYDPDYVGGGTHENLNGQDLDPHVDFNYHPRRQWHRRLNLIVFLNPEWEESWGGCLELMQDPWSDDGQRNARIVLPVANQAVIFETNERSWHGFRRIQLPEDKQGLSRRSLAIYLYTLERAREETAVSHGTIYVQRRLPERVEAGYTLGEGDVEEVRSLIERRDLQIRFLYERELEFSAALEELRKSPSFRLGRAMTWPARALRELLRRR